MITEQQRQQYLWLCAQTQDALTSVLDLTHHRFDTGLVEALTVCDVLHRYLADRPADFRLSFVVQEAAKIEACLQGFRGTLYDDELDDARRLVSQLHAIVAHERNRYAHGRTPVTQRAKLSRRTRYAKGLAICWRPRSP